MDFKFSKKRLKIYVKEMEVLSIDKIRGRTGDSGPKKVSICLSFIEMHYNLFLNIG